MKAKTRGIWASSLSNYLVITLKLGTFNSHVQYSVAVTKHAYSISLPAGNYLIFFLKNRFAG